MKKSFDAVKMTRKIRDRLSELYWKDKKEYFRQAQTAADKFKADLFSHKPHKVRVA
jgi:hypothetical protein